MQKKKFVYILVLGVVCLFLVILKTTTAKFISGFMTEEDVVGLQLNFNIGISNMEEYEEVTVGPNSYEVFHVEITNSTPNVAYYGVWYQMEKPKEINPDIEIARHKDNETPTTGSIDSLGKEKATIIIKNKSAKSIKINIGVASSKVSTGDIEYLDKKYLVSGSAAEADYVYDQTNDQYLSTTDNSVQMKLTSKNFPYNGTDTTQASVQSYTTPYKGIYKLEAWGAEGGKKSSVAKDGKGAYTKGSILLNKAETIYVYVGQGLSIASNITIFNGGTGNNGGYNGGGATDFRLVAGDWDNFNSLKSRIMVAAGSGSGEGTGAIIGSGGTLTGLPGLKVIGGTQTSFGPEEHPNFIGSSFGISNGGCTGGNGYYPGGSASCAYGSGGGSSFVSGCTGCNAIASSSTSTNIVHTGQPNHYSGKVFQNIVMISGDDSMPTHDGTSTMTGNSGHGYAKISLIVPTISGEEITIEKGSTVLNSQINCIDNGSGCQVVYLGDTSKLEIGTSTIPVYVKDDFGVIYQYEKEITITANT